MATMYFAKLSISSEIYEIYDNPKLYYDFLEKLYYVINSEKTIVDVYSNEYKLNSLHRDDSKRTITGRLSKIFTGNVETYDRRKDVPIAKEVSDLSSTVNFHFDVNSELIAYVTSRDFGYKQFLEQFKQLIETFLEDDEIKIEMNLLVNTEELTNQIARLKHISEIVVTLIPPNPPNKKEFNELFGERSKMLYETRTTKYTEKFETAIKMQAIA